MQYRVVFEFQSEDGAMSDVYNCRDEEAAKEKFAELRQEIAVIATATSQIIDEPAHYSVIDRDGGIYGYVRLLED